MCYVQPRNNNVAGTKYRGTYESDYFGDSHADIVTWVSSTGTVAEVLTTFFITDSIGIFAIFDCEKTGVETVKTQTNSKKFFIVSFFIFN